MKNGKILKSEMKNYCLNESLRNGNFRNCWSVTRSSNSSGSWIRMRSVSSRKRKRVQRKKNLRSFPSCLAPVPGAEKILP